MRSGERCVGCGAGVMRVYSVRTAGFARIRFLRCSVRCGHTGQEVVSVDDLGRAVILSNRAKPSTVAGGGTTPASVSFASGNQSPRDV